MTASLGRVWETEWAIHAADAVFLPWEPLGALRWEDLMALRFVEIDGQRLQLLPARAVLSPLRGGHDYGGPSSNGRVCY